MKKRKEKKDKAHVTDSDRKLGHVKVGSRVEYNGGSQKKKKKKKKKKLKDKKKKKKKKNKLVRGIYSYGYQSYRYSRRRSTPLQANRPVFRSLPCFLLSGPRIAIKETTKQVIKEQKPPSW